MKKSLLFFFAFSICLSTFAQNSKKQKEIGIGFATLNNFGITYKFGQQNALWRINTLMVSGSNITENSDSIENTNSSFGVSFRLGREYRKSITEKLELRYGFDLFVGINQSRDEFLDKSRIGGYNVEQKRETISPGVAFVFGFNYLINEQIILGAEMLPGVSYTMGENTRTYNDEKTTTELTSINYGLRSTSVLLTLAYRFNTN